MTGLRVCTDPSAAMLGRVDTGRVVVLLEGESDVAAVRSLARARGLNGAVELVDMAGVTNIRRHLDRLMGTSSGATVLGMCDAPEIPFVRRALAAHGLVCPDAESMAARGFHVCDADLEEELIRALGTDRVLQVLRGLGLAGRFATFQQQPAWSGRPLPAQLRRFAGVAAGRKALFAGALADAIRIPETPRPLAELLAQVQSTAGVPE